MLCEKVSGMKGEWKVDTTRRNNKKEDRGRYFGQSIFPVLDPSVSTLRKGRLLPYHLGLSACVIITVKPPKQSNKMRQEK